MRRPVAPPKGLMNRNNVAPLFGHAPVQFQEGETAGLGGFGGGFGGSLGWQHSDVPNENAF